MDHHLWRLALFILVLLFLTDFVSRINFWSPNSGPLASSVQSPSGWIHSFLPKESNAYSEDDEGEEEDEGGEEGESEKVKGGAETTAASTAKNKITVKKGENGERVVVMTPQLASELKSQILETLQNACLPKFICELHAANDKSKFTGSERNLINLLSSTSMKSSTTGSSKYHFAAHMGQLIAGVEGTGCYNFYPLCPVSSDVLLNIRKIKIKTS